MIKNKYILTISVLFVFLLLLNGGIFANYLKQRQLFSELKNNCQTGGLLFYNEGVLTCNNTDQVKVSPEDVISVDEDKVNDLENPSLNTINWTALTSYPTGCSAGQAVRVIGDRLTCFSIWDDISDLPLASPTDGDTAHLSTADQIYDWVTGKGYIGNDSNIPKNDLTDSGDLSFDWSNDEVADNLTVNSSGLVTWSALASYPTGCSAGQAVQIIGDTLTCISVGGSSLWTDGGDATYLAVTTDDLVIGGTDNTAPFYFDVGSSLLTITGLTVNNSVVFNEAGGDYDFRVEGDSEDNLFLVDAGTDEVRMGDWDTNYVSVDKAGDVVFVGGGGLAFGEIYIYGNSTEDTVPSGSYIQMTRFDTNGGSNNTTPDHTNDHVTINKAGMYLVTLSLAFSGDGGVTWDGGVFKNNGATQLNNLQTTRKLGAGGDVGSASISGIADFSENDTVEVWFRHQEGVSKDITIHDVTLSLVQIGG